MDDFYRTISQPTREEIKVKSSRFIAETKMVENSNEAVSAWQQIRKREHAATHHCYAYRIGLEAEPEFKYSDDGEPNGTAGKPIYDCIVGRKLTNVLVGVTRYYGGTKLGTGGLVRAYSDAAIKALEISGIRTVYLTNQLSIEIEFKYYDQLQKLIEKYKAKQDSSEFKEKVQLTLSVRKSKSDQLKNEIINLTHGQAKFE